MSAKKYISKINREGNDIYIKDSEARESLQYEDVYIGAALVSSTVITDTYHHDFLIKGRPISVTASSNYIWIVLPNASSTPILLIGGLEVPMVLDSTVTIAGTLYNIWKSQNTYVGTFNVCLF